VKIPRFSITLFFAILSPISLSNLCTRSQFLQKKFRGHCLTPGTAPWPCGKPPEGVNWLVINRHAGLLPCGFIAKRVYLLTICVYIYIVDRMAVNHQSTYYSRTLKHSPPIKIIVLDDWFSTGVSYSRATCIFSAESLFVRLSTW